MVRSIRALRQQGGHVGGQKVAIGGRQVRRQPAVIAPGETPEMVVGIDAHQADRITPFFKIRLPYSRTSPVATMAKAPRARS